MKLNKIFAAAAVCAIAAFSSVLPVSAALNGSTESSTMPTLQAPAPTSDAVPSVTFSGQTVTATASGGAVLGNSTQTDSASTGDAGVMIAVAGLFVTAGVGAAAVALKNKKK